MRKLRIVANNVTLAEVEIGRIATRFRLAPEGPWEECLDRDIHEAVELGLVYMPATALLGHDAIKTWPLNAHYEIDTCNGAQWWVGSF